MIRRNDHPDHADARADAAASAGRSAGGASVAVTIDELLLALIEGEPLGAAARVRVQTALAADPALARRVDAMRADRAGLQAIANAVAPADLLDRVQAELERADLLTLADCEHDSPTRLARSQVEYTGPGVIATIKSVLESRWLRPALAAAAIVVVAALSFSVIRAAMNRPKPLPIAKDTSVEPMVPQPEVPRETVIATDVDAVIPDPINNEFMGPMPDSTAVTTAIPAPKPVPFGMPLNRALALAKEGRLVIRVRAATVQHAEGQLAAFVDRPTTDRVLARVPNDLAGGVMTAVYVPPPASPVVTPATNPAPAIASDGPGAGTGIKTPEVQPKTPLTAQWNAVATPYALHFRPQAAELREFLERIERGDCTVVLEACTDSLKAKLGPDPGAILWWTSPGTWTERPAAAVIIETP